MPDLVLFDGNPFEYTQPRVRRDRGWLPTTLPTPPASHPCSLAERGPFVAHSGRAWRGGPRRHEKQAEDVVASRIGGTTCCRSTTSPCRFLPPVADGPASLDRTSAAFRLLAALTTNGVPMAIHARAAKTISH